MNKSSINILFVTASISGGGAERMLLNIINSLDHNHNARLIITSTDRISNDLLNKTEVYNLNKCNARNSFSKILIQIYRFRPDYIFTTSSNIGYMLIIANRLTKSRSKVIIRCAVSPSDIIKTTLIKGLLLKYLIQVTYKWCDLIIAQTDFMKQDIINQYRIKAEKVNVIRNIISNHFLEQESIKFKPKEFAKENFNIVASGALYSIKGFDLLIEAIAPIIYNNPHVHLWILGQERYEIGYKKRLQELINKSDISNNVKLLGYQNNPYPYYISANLLVMSSRKEGFPNVVLESLFLKTPVVATDCVDFSGIIYDGINGYVVAKENIIELRNGIDKSLKNNFNMEEYRIVNFDYNNLFT